MRLLVHLFVLVVAACGDNAKPCDYAERDDLGNGTTSELSGVTVRDHTVRLCGALDNEHYDPLLHAVDDDGYRITIATSGPVLVQIHGDPGVELLDGVVVRWFDTAVNPRLLGQGELEPSLADHGAFVVTLGVGVYDLVVTGRATADLSGSLDYRIDLLPMPACDAVTAPVDYFEDATRTTTNDVVDVNFSAAPPFTATAGASLPEPTGLEIAAGQRYVIEGGATAEAHGDEYLDRDTYELTTGDATTELAIRLDWDSDGTDLDYILFEHSATAPVVTSNTTSTIQRELAMFAVKPSTTYWLWIGLFAGSQPSVYHATICGNHYFF